MAAADLNTIRSTIEGRLATELASSPAILLCFTTWHLSQHLIRRLCNALSVLVQASI
jgi:hypothetical protein